MTAKSILEEWLSQTDQTNLKQGHYFVIEEAMKEYAKMKCKELLLMTAEKVIGREGLTAYDILAVDLNEFIK